MVLSIIPEEPRKARRKAELTHYRTAVLSIAKEPRPETGSTGSTSLTTSAIANRTSTTSTSTDDTLGMISTPWSTETWRSACSPPSFLTSHGSTSVAPKTTTTYGAESPEVKSNSESGITVTLLNEASLLSASCCVQPLKRHSSSTFSSWTLETYTSTGLVSDVVRVNYPWSPNTFSCTDFFSEYPSTLNLVSQKGSRETVGKDKVLSPMNYVVVLDDNPMLDWVLVKQKGIHIK